MKYLNLLLSFLLIALGSSLLAQAPEAFNYQAIARDASGNALIQQAVTFRFTLREGVANGTAVYEETHSTTSNEQGLVNLVIGEGNVVSGSLASVAWGENPYFLQVELDPAGGNAYLDMGTTQLLSVPYALHAQSSLEAETAQTADTADYARAAPASGGGAKFISINLAGTHVSGPADFSQGFGDNGGVALQPSSQTRIDLNFTVPPDYTPGDTFFIEIVGVTSSGDNPSLRPNYISIARPGVGYVQGGGASSGLNFSNPIPATAGVPFLGEGYIVSPINNNPIQPGDAITFGFFRPSGDANNTTIILQGCIIKY